MKIGFYPRLAWDGIGKNKRLYIPYILTGCVMVMMYYIISFLSESPAIKTMKGGSVMADILPLGGWIIAAFSLIFLFYTNSFLVKQRYREFGLYNILGMDKKNIAWIIGWESVFVTILALLTGLAAGIAFSKAGELMLLNLMKLEINYSLSIGWNSVVQTTKIYGIIYLLLLMNSIFRVSRSGALELMQTSKVGERPVKGNWIFALTGILCLAFAYYLAVSITEPLTAFVWFFVAVIIVILGTYLIFIAGSVVFCKMLQKNKAYYYKPNHFVSVSSMVYRMKRNGAGLASICILLTMVLVMISSSACLYFGSEDALDGRCPNDVNITTTFSSMDGISEENIEEMRAVLRAYSGEETDLTGVRACELPGFITNEGIVAYNSMDEYDGADFVGEGYLSVVSIDDYNVLMGENKTLEDGECFIYCYRLKKQWETFRVNGNQTYQVKEQLEEFQVDGEMLAMVTPMVYMVVNDLEAFDESVGDMVNGEDERVMMYDWRCGFDTDTLEEEAQAVLGIKEGFGESVKEGELSFHSYSVISRESKKAGFYDMYGSLFFLGIMLCIVFLLAAVLIIYYKQISEGYEDVARFDIMRKVGMTKRDIRRSINSQMLTVFTCLLYLQEFIWHFPSRLLCGFLPCSHLMIYFLACW